MKCNYIKCNYMNFNWAYFGTGNILGQEIFCGRKYLIKETFCYRLHQVCCNNILCCKCFVKSKRFVKETFCGGNVVLGNVLLRNISWGKLLWGNVLQSFCWTGRSYRIKNVKNSVFPFKRQKKICLDFFVYNLIVKRQKEGRKYFN